MRIITLLILLLLGTMYWGASKLSAQTSPIDTIVVDLSGSKSPQTNTEPTPALNIDALRNLAREDSIKLAEMKAADEKAELERIQELKEKRDKEKEEKESEQAARRKLEKEAKEQAAQEKKAAAKLATEAKNKEKEKLKQSDKKADELDKEKLAQEKKAAELVETERKRKEKLAEKEFEKDEQQKAAAEKAAMLNKIAEQKKPQPENAGTTTAPETNEGALSITERTKKELPQAPQGVKQEDNEYGTVRLAFDDLAASFLLSIPTETKMQYHPNHSKHIMLVEGEGMMLMGYKTIKLKKNELIFVTKGTPHKIINSGKGKVKVLSIMSPFYDGTDVIILE